MKNIGLILFSGLFICLTYADDSYNGKIFFNESVISVGAPVVFKAEIVLKGDDYIQEIYAIKEILRKGDEKNLRIFGIERVEQNSNNADILEVRGGIVFLNTSKSGTKVLTMGQGKSQLSLQNSDLNLVETDAVEKPEIFKINLADYPLALFSGLGAISLFGLCYFFTKKKTLKKTSQKKINHHVQSKADVELLYTQLIDELKYNEMPISQKNQYSALLKNIDEIQYKQVITAEELSYIELRLLEIQKEQNGNRI